MKSKTIFSTIFLAMFLIISIGLVNAFDYTSIRQYYNADGTEWTDSLGIYNGTMNGAISTGVNGILGNAFNFSGSDDGSTKAYITIDNFVINNLSVNFWIQKSVATGYPSTANQIDMFGTQSDDNTVIFKFGFDGTHTDKFDYQINVGSDGTGRFTNSPISDRNWHMITLTREYNGAVKYYYDSIEQPTTQIWISGTPSNIGSIDTAVASIGIGTVFKASIDDGNYNGLLDEYLIATKVLNQSEIDELYNSGNAFNPLPSCTENWIPQYDLECNGIIANHTLTYTDLNTCNTSFSLPMDNNTVVPCCVENWVSNNTICNTFNYTIVYYDQYSCNTTISLPILNGTIVDCACHPLWLSDVNTCINNVMLISYYDANICNSTENLPANNGTNTVCTTKVVNTVLLSDDQIIFIALGFFLIISLVGAIMLHEGFFGMCALIMGLILSSFIYYDYPVILWFMSMFMILLFSIMWIVIARAKR